MRKATKIVGFAAIAIVILSSATYTVSASKPTKEPFSALLNFPNAPTVGQVWANDLKVMHARGALSTGIITGDINGVIEVSQNMNLRKWGENGPIDGNAHVKGEITVTGESQVSYRITMVAFLEDRAVSGSFVADGIGSFSGQHVIGTISGSPNQPALLTLTGFRITEP